MNFFKNLIDAGEVWAHCDLMCGVYDPAQARIEAQSVYNAIKLYQNSNDEVFRQRAIIIKEERAEMVKRHLWVLWTDYFKDEHLKQFANLHDLFWRTTKVASEVKKSVEIKDAQKLLDLVDEIGYIFEQTKEGYNYGAVVENLKIQTK